MASLEVAGLSKTFASTRVLTDVSFSIPAGSIRGLLGMNGSGKSTLIKILSGYHMPDAGATVSVNGEELPFGDPAGSLHHGLRFVHQSNTLVGEMSAMENLALPDGFTTRRGVVNWTAQRRKTQDRLAQLGVHADVTVPVDTLRAVERTAVAIARAMDRPAEEISVLFLDEPTAAFSHFEVDELFGIVRDLAAAGVSIVYVSHRLREVLDLVDSVMVLRDGILRAEVDRSELDEDRLAELISGQVGEQNLVAAQRSVPTEAPELARFRGVSGPTLRGVDLDLAPREIVGVAGLSGSGRVELARVLCGHLPGTGTMEVESSGPQPLSFDAATVCRVALAPGNHQHGSFIGEFSLTENITLPQLGEFAGPAGALDRRREKRSVRDWIASLAISPAAPDRLLSSFSGGNQQKAILARTFGIKPRVLVLDEPTAGVDVAARKAIYQVVREWVDRTDAAVVVASSDTDDFVALCDRVVVLANGIVVDELHGDDINERKLLRAMTGDAATSTPGGPHE